MSPRETPWGIKNFTLTGDNTTQDPMPYYLTLVITKNTFTEGTLKYKLISTNTDDNGEVAPSTSLRDIKTGEREVHLGNGSFQGPTDGDKVHSYTLEIYFPELGIPQDEDQDKEFEAYVTTTGGTYVCEDCLAHKIITEYGGIDNIVEAPEGTFATASGTQENRLYKMEDDYGMSY